MAPLHNSLVEEMRFPAIAPPLPHAGVYVNGVRLERHDRVVLETNAPIGWSVEPDGTLVALLRRTQST